MGRIYFHWLVRESGQAAWFEDLLNDLAKDDPRCFLDLNIHITREKPPVWSLHNCISHTLPETNVIVGIRNHLCCIIVNL